MWGSTERKAMYLMLQGPTDQLGQGMQEGSLAKAGLRVAPSCLGPLGEHGGLPRGHARHSTPGLAHTAGLLADDAHAAIPVSLHNKCPLLSCCTVAAPVWWLVTHQLVMAPHFGHHILTACRGVPDQLHAQQQIIQC